MSAHGPLRHRRCRRRPGTAASVRIRRTALLLGGLALGACDGAGGPDVAPGPVVRDSAGIRIVEHAGPGSEDAPRAEAGVATWRVPREPDRSVGILDGEAAYQLTRVSDLLLLSDGTLVLADGGSGEVRAFRPDGSVAWIAGGLGDGPGEFRALGSLTLLSADSVLVWDPRTRRNTVIGPEGAPGRSWTPEVPTGAAMAAPVGLLEGGRLLVSSGVSFSGGDGATDEVVRPPVTYHLADLEGAILDSLMSVPMRAMRVRRAAGSISVGEVPLAPESFVAALGDRIAVVRGEEGEVRVHDADGRLRSIVRVDLAAGAPDSGDRAAWEEHRLAGVDAQDLPAMRRFLAEAEMPERYPVVSALELDPAGRVWMRLWSPPWAGDQPGRWRVFDSDGMLVARVETPPGLEVERITENSVLGVTRDELGVERARVYRIER